jgi:hypothetical protein
MCVKSAPGGQVLCESCHLAWQNFQQPFVAATAGAPNPVAAGVLGFIPGVGAMYNGQFFKGLIHVVIFAVLVSLADHYGIFGIFIAAWILYQAFEAYHTARARRDGQPLPDPLGLNELGNWFNFSGRPNVPPAAGTQGGANWGVPYQQYQQPPQAQGGAAPGYNPASPQAQGGVAPGYIPVPPVPPVPPMPPIHPVFWQRKEPIGAIALIALGALFLLGKIDFFNGRLFEFTWPMILIGLGVWLFIRRSGYGQGGHK